jgi:hypothetical protein
MKIHWLEHDISNKASLISTLAWINIATVGLGGSWHYALGASVVAVTFDKLVHEIKIAGEE